MVAGVVTCLGIVLLSFINVDYYTSYGAFYQAVGMVPVRSVLRKLGGGSRVRGRGLFACVCGCVWLRVYVYIYRRGWSGMADSSAT
jgi:hypothetical protein